MNDTSREPNDHPADERPLADGGTDVAGEAIPYRTVVDRTGGTGAADVPRLGDRRDGHLFGPAELPRWALSLPAVGALAVAVGAQGSTALAAGGGSAWSGTVAAAVGLLVVVGLAVRTV